MASVEREDMGEDTFIEHLKRLKFMAGGQSSLQPFLQGFHESGFQAQLQHFVSQRAPHFAEVSPDGSHPLVWTQLHREYRGLFDAQLEAILVRLGIDPEEFQEFCGWLREFQCNLGDDFELEDGIFRAKDVEPFLDALTASERYDVFLSAMLAELKRQQEGPPLSAATVQELEVTVPEGVVPGQAIAVEYQGAAYNIVVPEGLSAGMAFRAAVTVPVPHQAG